MDGDAVAVLDLDQDIEGRRRLALEHRLLRAPPPRLLVGKGDALDASEQIVQRRVDEEVLQGLAVRRGDELDAAFGDGTRGAGLELGADLVDDDDLRHVVLDRLDHHRVLKQRRLHLHAPRAADARMRNVAVATDLVRRVDDDDALAQLVREQARALAQHRRLANAGPAQEQDALAADDDVADDLPGARHRAAHAHGQADDASGSVADRGDTVERALDAGAVVVAELADVVRHMVEVRRRDRMVGQQDFASRHARLRLAAKVEHDLQQFARVDAVMNRAREVRRQRSRQELGLLVPAADARRFSLGTHPKDGTRPFSRTGLGTRTASSLTRSSCVRRTVNPRPRRASIMCES